MEKTLEVLNELVGAGVIVEYAIAGAMGATFYLEPVLTVDLDIFVAFKEDAPSLLPLSSIYKALAERGYHPDKHEKECINIEGVPVQFLPSYNPLTIEALSEALSVEYGSVETKVVSPEHLTAIALQTGRLKDKLRVIAFYESRILDAESLSTILKRHNLWERWQEWIT